MTARKRMMDGKQERTVRDGEQTGEEETGAAQEVGQGGMAAMADGIKSINKGLMIFLPATGWDLWHPMDGFFSVFPSNKKKRFYFS
jgi:hypothetical protein